MVIQCGELVKVGQFFLNQLQKITFPDPHFTEHSFFYSCCHILLQLHVTTDHHVIHIFYIFLGSFSSTSSGFHPVFTIHIMEKYEKWISGRLKAKDFLFDIKIVFYSLVNYFLLLGIQLQTWHVYLCIWNISLLLLRYFCSWKLQLFKCLQC